jgi:hypothetical protein
MLLWMNLAAIHHCSICEVDCTSSAVAAPAFIDSIFEARESEVDTVVIMIYDGVTI